MGKGTQEIPEHWSPMKKEDSSVSSDELSAM